ncbi:uncharacterized protein GGS22DRAFT_172471 [Annulohypoxylon maeteangense]|uniref:uncharacterized protein n=1 Tax=Annulohypoxylon maeteangense TaxID=1927788 RepID=UPI002008DAE8|nr:uncharacterized protein GGS22DRAFT_172471 [Annulohypoxylon maeteangense]KAI0881564.1 hypothetical protein GGS22DRAFT_172471 [Annulohypoxylon maeteangense]
MGKVAGAGGLLSPGVSFGPGVGRSASKERRSGSRTRENGNGNGVVDGSSGLLGAADIGLPFDEGDTKLTLRTKGLRENVGAHA